MTGAAILFAVQCFMAGIPESQLAPLQFYWPEGRYLGMPLPAEGTFVVLTAESEREIVVGVTVPNMFGQSTGGRLTLNRFTAQGTFRRGDREWPAECRVLPPQL